MSDIESYSPDSPYLGVHVGYLLKCNEDLERRVKALEATVKAFEKYSDRYTRFFSSFDEPFQGTTLT